MGQTEDKIRSFTEICRYQEKNTFMKEYHPIKALIECLFMLISYLTIVLVCMSYTIRRLKYQKVRILYKLKVLKHENLILS